MNALQLLLDFGLLLLIWIVQLIIYPSFTFMDEAGFQRWHPPYTQVISYFVVPLMLAQVALYSYLLIQEFRWLLLIQLILIGVAWANTFLVAVPLHNTLGSNTITLPYRTQLVRINRWRTAAWTLVFLLTVWQFFRQYLKSSNF
ncbi:MAG: hypothetical protein KDC44_04460 [Phaeodactylibacter sp.]|nr:hypothetical protein [Phaeodactylibacter sp.]